jgi:hypothetical protein
MRTLIWWSAFLTFGPPSMLAQLLHVDQRADLYGNWSYGIRTNAPMGQTFTPSSNAVGFVQLQLYRGGPSVMHLNLRRGGINGPLIAQSRRLEVARGFQVPILFDFGTNVPVNAGELHCAEPIIDSGDDCSLVIYHYSYPKGEAIVRGVPVSPVADMWFREGPVASFPRFTAVSVGPPGSAQVQATLSGLIGQQVAVEVSNDGTRWLRHQTNLFTNSVITFNSSNVVTPTFYRASYLIP